MDLRDLQVFKSPPWRGLRGGSISLFTSLLDSIKLVLSTCLPAGRSGNTLPSFGFRSATGTGMNLGRKISGIISIDDVAAAVGAATSGGSPPAGR